MLSTKDPKYRELIDYIIDNKLLVKLKPGQNLCHISPTSTLDFEKPMYFAGDCDYGIWLQYERNTLDDPDDSVNRIYDEEEEIVDEDSEEEVGELNLKPTTPEFFYSVEVTVPKKDIILVDNSKPEMREFHFWYGKYNDADDENRKILKSLLNINGIDGFYGKDPFLTGILYELGVDEVVLFHPNQIFENFKVNKITQETLQARGRRLETYFRHELAEGYAEYNPIYVSDYPL